MEFVEQYILPALDPHIKVMKLKGGVTPYENNKFGSILPAEFLREIKRNRKSLSFPCVIKIVNGEVIDVSLRDELYNTISKNLPSEIFLEIVLKSLEKVRSDSTAEK